ncbi:hypothetical protein C2845_PM08G16170 [Panicum miliaceum]|uniref:Uncharacterized protein n=1 Tax=Panicum miliaceum TaxID=4540 RepID=A0A3L6QWU5_PANMI|nr:hypothetical protein C2845_PM08G16170 [Panicum miliaceum]
MAPPPPRAALLLLLLLLLPHNAAVGGAGTTAPSPAVVNPFTAKAAFIRYWNRKVPNNRLHPAFFVAKVSPLPAADTASFPSALPDIRARLPALCSRAGLLCAAPAAGADAASLAKAAGPFKSYSNVNFSNYGIGGDQGADSFRNYSPDLNIAADSFRRYGRDSSGRADRFESYEADGNVVTANFTSYAGGATGGSGSFAPTPPGSKLCESSFVTMDTFRDSMATSIALA